MAHSHIDDDLMRFLQQTAEYFEFDEIDHVFSCQTAANDETFHNVYSTYNYIKQLTSIADKSNHTAYLET